jgi:hypothetical protein
LARPLPSGCVFSSLTIPPVKLIHMQIQTRQLTQ